MKLGVKQFLGREGERCEELNALLVSINDCLVLQLPDLTGKGSSDLIRKAVRELILSLDQEWTSPTAWPIEAGVRPGPYKIDWVRNISDCKCGESHRVFIDICFDNAQVVATNLLKLTKASSDYLANAKTRSSSMIVIVTLEKGSASLLGWDNSVGTREEYDFVFRSVFSSTEVTKPYYFSFSASS
jgi:hypothetical protein